MTPVAASPTVMPLPQGTLAAFGAVMLPAPSTLKTHCRTALLPPRRTRWEGEGLRRLVELMGQLRDVAYHLKGAVNCLKNAAGFV
jgi:hypothetical protein